MNESMNESMVNVLGLCHRRRAQAVHGPGRPETWSDLFVVATVFVFLRQKSQGYLVAVKKQKDREGNVAISP